MGKSLRNYNHRWLEEKLIRIADIFDKYISTVVTATNTATIPPPADAPVLSAERLEVQWLLGDGK